MKYVLIILGAVGVLLGGLWLVQGMGLVTIPPILCVAECETLEGPDTTWTIVGALTLFAGAAAIAFGLRRRRT